MITGDTIETARAIGREIGLLDSPDAIVDARIDEFNALQRRRVEGRSCRTSACWPGPGRSTSTAS